MEQLPVKQVLNEPPSLAEVKKAINQINNGKAPGMDRITAEILKYGGASMDVMLHEVVSKAWESGAPQDWKDAIMVSIFKKGLTDDCGNYRGISLLSIVGKVFARILLNKLLQHITPNILPESQCGFRANRGTVDMIFSARQLQEKCLEQNLNLYHCFIDLTKAFDTVNREALWKILLKIGCPNKFTNLIRSLHDGMQARVNFNCTLSEEIPVENGVKQGDIFSSNSFCYFLLCCFYYYCF